MHAGLGKRARDRDKKTNSGIHVDKGGMRSLLNASKIFEETNVVSLFDSKGDIVFEAL